MSNITIHNTDVIEWLTNYNGPKFHGVISDPPYGLAFMGKEWDKYTPEQYQSWCKKWGSELIKHLYPGAVCMFFGGTRTYHRLATGLEDAGFEIFDSMMFLYGSGFPKATDISKGIDKKFNLEREIVETKQNSFGAANGKSWDKLIETNEQSSNHNFNITKPNHPLAQKWNGYKTCLKPAYEPIILCRKPRGKETFVDCALNYGTGSLNVDSTRIETNDNLNGGGYSGNTEKLVKELYGEYNKLKPNDYIQPLGRFPANLGLICECEKEPCECFIDQFPKTQKENRTQIKARNGKGTNGIYGDYGKELHNTPSYPDSGNASRFFYTAKSSRKERNLGLDHMEAKQTNDGRNKLPDNAFQRGITYRTNNHPTVKPIKLTEYLAKMILPPIEGSSILIPFSGSGSEIIGAMFAGWNVITGIEIDNSYCDIANNRLDYWKQFDSYDAAMKR